MHHEAQNGACQPLHVLGFDIAVCKASVNVSVSINFNLCHTHTQRERDVCVNGSFDVIDVVVGFNVVMGMNKFVQTL